jgi:hypothetical protein
MKSQKLHICIKLLVHYDTHDYKKGLSNKVTLFTGITTQFQLMPYFPKLIFQVLNLGSGNLTWPCATQAKKIKMHKVI